MTRSIAALAALLLVAPACLGPDPNLTDTGKAKPQITAEFPPQVAAGEPFDLRLDIANPGPGDMDGIVVAFARLGDPSLPAPVVEAGAKGENDAVLSVDPDPAAVSIDGIIYTFGALNEGESTTVTFELQAPAQTGSAGNSVQVYDAQEPDRARGVRLLIDVTK